MSESNSILAPVYDLVGQTLTDIGAYYEVLTLRFGEYEIHVSCFARIIHNGQILLSTQDYQSWDEQDYKHNDMYLNIADHGSVLIGQAVRSVYISPVNDLVIVLDNDARIEIFSSNGNLRLWGETEQWFFYKPKDETYPFLSVSNAGPEQGTKEL